MVLVAGVTDQQLSLTRFVIEGRQAADTGKIRFFGGNRAQGKNQLLSSVPCPRDPDCGPEVSAGPKQRSCIRIVET